MKFIKDPVNHFIKLESSSSIILFGAALSAIILANSPLSSQFLGFWENYITLSVPRFELSKPIYKWINDGLMAIFFFLIGLELKRELLTGELSHFKKASLPFFAAVGGMIVPALFFTFLNRGNNGGTGWGIPMAADIAFSLGILMLLGNRAPKGLKVLLMTIAIIGDLSALLIITFFFSTNIIWSYIFIGLAIILLLLILSKRNYYSKYFFFIGGVIVWILFLKSGVHATIAGVLMAFTIPYKRKTDSWLFYTRSKEVIDEFMEECSAQKEKTVLSKKQLHIISELEELTEDTTSPLQHSEQKLHGWVSYLIMPVFAFANSGVVFSFSGDTNLALTTNIALSMVVGNVLGIFIFSWFAIKFKFAELPGNINFIHILGVSFLGGVGFTLALFMSGLALSGQALIDSAKMGILFGSLIAGLLGYLTIRFASKK